MRLLVFAALFVLCSFTTQPSGIGVEIVQGRSDVTMSSTLEETIDYEFLNSSDQVVLSGDFEAPGSETVNTGSLPTGNYTLVCTFSTGVDEFSLYIDNE